MSKRVLIVDDDPFLLKLVSDILSPEGYDVTPARSGSEAIRIIEREQCRFDLVILDYRMPVGGDIADPLYGINGTVTSMFLREKCPDLKVIFTSGAQVDLVEDGDFIQKPFTGSQLLEKVRGICG